MDCPADARDWSDHVSQVSCCWRHRIIFRLNSGCAPGLEQKHSSRSSDRGSIHGVVRCGCDMGSEDVETMALKSKAKKQAGTASPNAFAGQVEPPTQKAVEIALGPS